MNTLRDAFIEWQVGCSRLLGDVFPSRPMPPTAKPYPVLPPTHVSVPASRYPSVDTLWREPHPLDRTPPEGPCPIEDHLAGASCPRCHVPTPKAELPVELL